MMDKQGEERNLPQHGVQSMSEATPTMTESRIEVAALSDIGYQRLTNEDRFGYDLEASIFVVCDGMGGHAAGEIASRMAVEITIQTYRELSQEEMTPVERLHAAISRANQAIWNMAKQDRTLLGMGTTLVAACLLSDSLLISNVGDSRAYFLSDGDCGQVTQDHSYAAERLREGWVSASDELPARLQQIITRAVGVDERVNPDFFIGNLGPGDTVLLATDGLTRYADAEKLAGLIYTHSDLEDTCRKLIAVAHGGGAEDNVTCLLFRLRSHVL